MIHSPVTEFCRERGIPDNIKRAFSSFVSSELANKFDIKDGTDTIKIMIGKLSQEQVEKLWQDFVREMIKYLPLSQ